MNWSNLYSIIVGMLIGLEFLTILDYEYVIFVGEPAMPFLVPLFGFLFWFAVGIYMIVGGDE